MVCAQRPGLTGLRADGAQDVETVAQDALDVLRGLSAPNATYVLVFDIDETVLSNMAEFEHMRYGKKPYDGAWEHAWQVGAHAPWSRKCVQMGGVGHHSNITTPVIESSAATGDVH